MAQFANFQIEISLNCSFPKVVSKCWNFCTSVQPSV